MTDKTIKELVEEAQELGINIHDHVAKDRYGEVNMVTRQLAKQEAFGALYGDTSNVAKQQDITSPWMMTEETKAPCQERKEFKKEPMNEPYTVYADCPAVDIPLAKERKFRAGVTPFKVGIFDDDGLVVTLPVHATSALDARCIAYIIDRGRKMQQWGDEQIELALACTKVVG